MRTDTFVGQVIAVLSRRTATIRLPLEQATDELAEQVRRQWVRVAAERELTPVPIPVRWQWSNRQVTSSPGEAVDRLGGRRLAPIPGMAAVTEEQLHSGTLNDLLFIYGGLASGRLIVLGEPGAGKSSAGILLLLDALAYRAALTAEDRIQVPVPVMVTPHGWDPTAQHFTDWLADRLTHDYPLLRAPEYGKDAALHLIEDGHLAVILDGLDEVPEVLRSAVLRALDEQVTFRLVVLSRSEELVAAVCGGHLRAAAAVELLPIAPREAAEYLVSSQLHPLPTSWQHLIDYLREHPDSALAQSLSTPLMLTLVRETYDPGDEVDELIEESRFPSRNVIENHLLDRILPAAYAQRSSQLIAQYTVAQASRWLGLLARHMNEEQTRDLAWWQIPRWVPMWPRALITAVIMSVVPLLILGPLIGYAIRMDLLSAFRVRPPIALVGVFGNVLGLGFMFGLGQLLMYPHGAGSYRQQGRPWWSRADIFTLILLSVGVGAGVGLERMLTGGLEYSLVSALMTSVVVGLGFVLGGGLLQQLGWLRRGRIDAGRNILTGLVVGIAASFAVGFSYGIVYGLKYAIAPGLIVGIVYVCVTILGGRAMRQDESPWSRTGIPTTLLIGLCIAIASSSAFGITYVLIVVLGKRPPLQRAQPLRWSNVTLKTVLGGLVIGLALGLMFVFAHELGLIWLPGLLLGLLFGLTIGLVLGLGQPSMEAIAPLDPHALWHRERRNGFRLGFGLGLAVALTGGLSDWLVFGPGVGLVFGLVGGLVVWLGSGLVSSVTWTAGLANAQLSLRGETPLRLLRFLDDARYRQILRAVGPVYQFRDARLQDRLAEMCESLSGKPRLPSYRKQDRVSTASVSPRKPT